MSELRIGTAERERAVSVLGDHYAEGRLSREEYDERSDAAWSARTGSDLARLFTDLPGGCPVAAAAPRAGLPRDVPHGPGLRRGARDVWRDLPVWLRVVLGVLAVVVAVNAWPVILVAVVVYVLAVRRQRRTPPPPWPGG